MRILFTGGGTGGHIFPLVAVARELKKLNSSQSEPLELFYLGPDDDFAFQALTQEGIRCEKISAGKLRRYADFQNFLDMFSVIGGIFQCLWKLLKIMPDVVFSKGGYGSIPVVFVSRLYFIPIIIHESDSVPGLANRIGAKFAKKIAVSFARTLKFFPPGKTALIGHPVRREILNYEKNQARKDLGLNPDFPVILFLGGSQGAQRINEIILRILQKLEDIAETIHQCGSKNYDEYKQDVEIVWNKPVEIFSHYHLFSFLDEKTYSQALAASDLVISRAGAGTIFEIAAAQKPSILIPLAGSASDHQRVNAYEYAKIGAAEIIEEANLTPNLFLSQIENLLKNTEKMRLMAQRAKSFVNLDAAMIIAREIVELTK